MKPKNCLIFGASGQIGRNLIRSLTKNNIKVTALTRNIHQKGYILKTQANPGYLEIVEGSIFDHELIEKLFINADPGAILIGKQRDFCRSWPNQSEITVPGSHFIQEDSPDLIGEGILSWLKTKNI